MTSTRDALTRAVCADPADDTARLLYADALMDEDTPESVALADFVRVQVELAELDCHHSTSTPWCRTCIQKQRFVLLERELWSVTRPAFETLDSAVPYLKSDTDDPVARATPSLIVSRGFVSSVRCTLADWVGSPCSQCAGRGQRTVYGDGSGPCQYCNATGRTPALGPRIVAEHPVEEVRTERTPSRNSSTGNYGWFRWGNMEENLDTVPEEIFDMMKSAHQFPPREMKKPASLRQMYWDTPELAQSALSLALVNWARRESGLPPLEERR